MKKACMFAVVSVLMLTWGCQSPAEVSHQSSNPQAMAQPHGLNAPHMQWHELSRPNQTPPAKTVTFLGVMAAPVDEALRAQLSLPPGEALMVMGVAPGSPAAQAGIKQFDVLTKFNNQTLVNPEQLNVLVNNAKAGQEVDLTVIRQAKQTPVKVKLASHEAPRFMGQPGGPMPGMQGMPGMPGAQMGRGRGQGMPGRMVPGMGNQGPMRPGMNNQRPMRPGMENQEPMGPGQPGREVNRPRVIEVPEGKEGEGVRIEIREGKNGQPDVRVIPEGRQGREGSEAREGRESPEGREGRDAEMRRLIEGALRATEERNEGMRRPEGPANRPGGPLPEGFRGEMVLQYQEDGSTVQGFHDNEYALKITTNRQGNKTVIARTVKDQKIVFEGSINTPDERAKMPAPVRRRFEQIQRNPEFKLPAPAPTAKPGNE